MFLLPVVPASSVSPVSLAVSCSPETAALVVMAVQYARLELQAHGMALFLEESKRLRLVLSDQIGQVGLDLVAATWAKQPVELEHGAPVWNKSQPFLFLPCVVRGLMRGVVCFEMLEPGARVFPSRIQMLLDLVNRAVTRLDDELTGRPENEHAVALDDSETVKLTLALERNEWNVSRVARLFGVTRMTVYNRMRRANVPRQRVPKSRKTPTRHKHPTRPAA